MPKSEKNTATQIISQIVEKYIDFCEEQEQLLLNLAQESLNFIVEENKKARQEMEQIMLNNRLSLEEKLQQTRKNGKNFRRTVDIVASQHRRTAHHIEELYKTQASFLVRIIPLSGELMRSAASPPNSIEIEIVMGKIITKTLGPASHSILIKTGEEYRRTMAEMYHRAKHEAKEITQDEKFTTEEKTALVCEANKTLEYTLDIARINCSAIGEAAQELYKTNVEFFNRCIQLYEEQLPAKQPQTEPNCGRFFRPSATSASKSKNQELESLEWPEGFSLKKINSEEYKVSLLMMKLKSSPHFNAYQATLVEYRDDAKLQKISSGYINAAIFENDEAVKALHKELMSISTQPAPAPSM